MSDSTDGRLEIIPFYPKFKKVLYLCDRRACKHCGDPCQHTPDIRHAKNFEAATDGSMWEKPSPLLIFKTDVLLRKEEMERVQNELLLQARQGLILCGPTMSIESGDGYTMYDVTITKRKVE